MSDLSYLPESMADAFSSELPIYSHVQKWNQMLEMQPKLVNGWQNHVVERIESRPRARAERSNVTRTNALRCFRIGGSGVSC